MFLAVVYIQFEVPLAKSLKDRRGGVEPFKARVARIAYYAVAEESGDKLWNWAEIWVAVLAQSVNLLDKRVEELRMIAETNSQAVLIRFDIFENFDLND